MTPRESTKPATLRPPSSALAKRRASTSSERGRKYRARMHQLVQDLSLDVASLKRTVAELDARRSLLEVHRLQLRQDPHGSLGKLVHKYFTLLEESMASLPPPASTAFLAHDDAVARELELQSCIQARFLRHIMDPEVVAGDLVGPLAVLDQWRRYQSTHAAFRAHVIGIETCGDEDEPVVTLHARATGKITGATLYTLFPHAAVCHSRADGIRQRLLNKQVSYTIQNRYLFGDDGRIRAEIVSIDFVKGLVDAGATLADVAFLMKDAAISPHCTLQWQGRDPGL
jgi:hypothetical protein